MLRRRFRPKFQCCLPSVTRRRRVQQSSVTSSHELVEDAKVVSKASDKHKASKQPAAVEPSAVVEKPKLANSELLLKALKKILGKQAKPVGHVEMAKVSGLPRGSIGASIKKLVETNKLVVEFNGFFKLV